MNDSAERPPVAAPDAAPPDPAPPAEAGADEGIIVVRGLTKRFKDHVAVDGLDITVQPGEIFGLVGPDGAGKTTTIRLLAAIMAPSAGRITVLGHDAVADPESIKPDIGYMAQRFNLYRDLSVEENMSFFADVFEVEGGVRDARITRLLEFARLEDFRDRRAEHLSGGMQKKLALATTLVHAPRILYLDEPTTGVDPVSRREFWEILTDLHLEGITIVVSTPYMDEAERCSRVGLMYHGRIIVCDAPEAIRELPQGEMLEVRAANLKRARDVIGPLEGVMEVQTYGDRLHVFVADAEQGSAAVQSALKGEGIEVDGVRTTRPRMEEAFISLIRQREGTDSDG